MNLCKKKCGTALWICLLSVLLLVGTFLTGCGADKEANNKVGQELSAPIRIASLKGPTGMGLAYMMNQSDQYEIITYQSPEEAVSKLLSGEVDIAAASSNLGSVLYNKTKGDLRLLSVNTGGVLYLVENGNSLKDIQDLKGKTIVASGKGGTPEYVLERILLDNEIDPEKDVTINWLGNHTDVAGALMAQPGSIALLPEPFVSVVSSKNEEISIMVDLNDIWQQRYQSNLPMGIFLATKKFTDERTADLNIFLNDCKDSVNRVNETPADAASIIVEGGILDNAEIVEKAIPRCNIIAVEGEDAFEALDNFYQILFEMEPASIGGTLPDITFYFNVE